jgi:hypothetical protein
MAQVDITTQPYAVPFDPFSLAQAADLVHTVAEQAATAMITRVESRYSVESIPDPEYYRVWVRGTAKVHSAMLGEYEWDPTWARARGDRATR